MAVTFPTGFNRYIVECKLAQGILENVDVLGFNRYIVECKSPKTSIVGGFA